MTGTAELDFRDRGVRANVILHERELRAFLATWDAARAAGTTMPPSDDPDCADLAPLLHHVLACAGGYVRWVCLQLDLPAPPIGAPPPVEEVAARKDDFAAEVQAGWRTALVDVDGAALNRVFPSAWGVDYCVDAMLEHAVMHPMRHRLQLEELLTG